jgi:glycerol kinase
MKPTYVIALDQGTTSSRALLVGLDGRIIDIAQQEFTQIYPKPGWVEHSPVEIIQTQLRALNKIIERNRLQASDIAAIGITNQRETTVIWDRKSGEPIYNAIVWQDKRTAPICEQLIADGLRNDVKQKTGLLIDSYFSGTKIRWILDNVVGAAERAERGELAFGTVDSWLIWNLTNGKVHATDVTNASRTMLYDINKMDWDDNLLHALGVPKSILPTVHPNTHVFGQAETTIGSIPILGVAGDQHAALFGQACFEPGMAKNTYGTGCFMLMNIGESMQVSNHGLLTTLAWHKGGRPVYALEGSVFVAGAAVQWLRDGLKIIDQSKDSEYFATKALGSNEVYMVPAFTGLGAPYWDMYARGAIFGLTRDTGKDHIIKATLEAIAYQTKDILEAMQLDSGIKLQTLKVDGGACVNAVLMQFQADILGCEVERPTQVESTALGAAYFAGIHAGIWDQQSISAMRTVDRVFKPDMETNKREKLYSTWKKAVERTLDWVNH